jgi:TPR repeat protein
MMQSGALISLTCLFVILATPSVAGNLDELTNRAERGDAGAQFSLGKALFFGEHGAERNHILATEWYFKSAKQGYVSAQMELAFSYLEGTGIPKDYVLAYMWMNIAAANETMLANPAQFLLVETFEPLLQPDALEYAQRLSSICMQSNYETCGH